MPVALTLVTTKISPDSVTCPLGDQVPLWGNLEKKYQARLWLPSLDFLRVFRLLDVSRNWLIEVALEKLTEMLRS